MGHRMSQPDFASMSRKELHTYVLDHREDQSASKLIAAGCICEFAKPADKCFAAILPKTNMPVAIMRQVGIRSSVRLSWGNSGFGVSWMSR
jgi:hypothetical protein